MIHKVKVRVNSSMMTSLKIFSVMLSLTIAILPRLVYVHGYKLFKLDAQPFLVTSRIGMILFFATICFIYLYSRFSPIKILKIRKKLILFTEQLTKQTEDGMLKHSVEWHYEISDKKITIKLFSNGLIPNKDNIGEQLSEYLRKNLRKKEELFDCTRFIFGDPFRRLQIKDLLNTPCEERYQIELYPEVIWNFSGKGAGHNLMVIADTGVGKTMLLYTLIARLTQQGHIIQVIDAKDSEFGEICLQAGYSVAQPTPEGILNVVREFHSDMKDDYSKMKSFASAGMTFATANKQAHFLIIDEALEALQMGDKKQNAELLKLLESIGRLGRGVGYILLIGAQSLNASDASTKLKMACGTKIIMGGSVTEEAFKSAMGLYKKDIGTKFKGGNGKGYAYTPTNGLTYFESPFIDTATEKNFCSILHQLLRERE